MHSSYYSELMMKMILLPISSYLVTSLCLQVSCCPTCRKYLVGRSTIAEKLARALWGEEGEREEEGDKITLTGYREVKPSSIDS